MARPKDKIGLSARATLAFFRDRIPAIDFLGAMPEMLRTRWQRYRRLFCEKRDWYESGSIW